jgi:1-acyl-sn-glycerol-3-phosphate acyltransferase
MYGLMAVMGIAWLIGLIMPRRITMFGIRLYSAGVRWGLRVICGVQTIIRGAEHVPAGPVIYAPRHQCMFDIFVPFLVLKDPAIIMKQELLFYPAIGWYALKAAMIPIDRAGNVKTLKKMLAAAKQRAEDDRQIVIFPEGTRAAPDAKAAYHAAGISALYRALDVPVVPVATNAGLFWPAHGITRTPGVAVYEILPPIQPGLNRKELMRELAGALDPATERLVAEGRTTLGERHDERPIQFAPQSET